MFQFPPFAPSSRDGTSTAAGGFPHSEIPGSSRICRSPGLIAAYHVLLRLHEPRYPPFALLSFLLYSWCLLDTEIRFSFSSSFQHVKDHWPFSDRVENKGLEPLTPCVQGRCSKPTELIPRSGYNPSLFPPPLTFSGRPQFFYNFREEPSQETLRLDLQKGGVPAAPSGTATLLRLSPSHWFYPRPVLAVPDFRHPQLPWLDGRCVQGPGTYSPRHG